MCPAGAAGRGMRLPLGPGSGRSRASRRRPRVLHLTPEFPPVIWGGLGTAVGGLVGASAAARLEVAVLLVGGALVLGGGAGYGSAPEATFGGPSPRTRRGAALEAVRFFRVLPEEAHGAGVEFAVAWRPRVIHLHSAWLWPLAEEICRRTGASLVFTVHSLDRAEYDIGNLPVDWRGQDDAIAHAARVIVLSRSERDLVLRYHPQIRDRLAIVGNGIDPPRGLASARRERHGRGGDPAPVVLYSGRFVERKGIRDLLEAIPAVLEQAPSTRFVLIGGYGGGAEIERQWLAEELRAHRRQVHFTGWLPPDEVARWYCEGDVLVIPSWYEPFGMVVLEGMAHGLALCATAVGGPAEILRHRETALLFPPHDGAALGRCLGRLVRDPDLMRKLAENGMAEVRRKWLWRRLIPRFESVYREAVACDRPLSRSTRTTRASTGAQG